MEPIVFGDYPKIMRDLVKERLPLFTEEEKKLIKGSFDFIGINYYTTRYGKNVPASQAEPLSYHNDVLATSTETNANGVLIGPHADGSIYIFSYPQGLQKLLEFMKQNYQSPKIYISENGITEEKDDNLGLDVAVKDPHRIECILRHLYRIRMAMKNGVNVKGYFHWALFDDFEWGEGYSSDFTMSTTKTISSAFLKNLLSGYQISWLGCHIWYAEATRLGFRKWFSCAFKAMDSFEPDGNGTNGSNGENGANVENDANGENRADGNGAEHALPPPPPVIPPDVVPLHAQVDITPEPLKKKIVRLPIATRGLGTKGQKILIDLNLTI